VAAQDYPSTELVKEFQKALQVNFKEQVLGARATTFAIGGPLSILVEPENKEELIATIRFVKAAGLKCRVLGAGSNLLIPDSGVTDWVVRLGRGFRSYEQTTPGIFRIGAAMPLMVLSRELSDAGMAGLEFAGGIPASVGGAVKMNAGAHGGQMADLISAVEIVDLDGRVTKVPVNDLSFSYRRSSIPRDAVVMGIELKLTPGDRVQSRAKRQEFLEHRKKYQPLTTPSAGSVFKNPSAERSAGKLIQDSGLCGYTIGGAKVSEIHGNWIINEGKNAKAVEVEELIQLCQSKVAEKFSIALEPELVRW